MKERHERILELLKEHNKLSVGALASRLFVSEMTIRRDLKELEASNYIQRYNGGAILCHESSALPISERKLLHSKEKMELAKKATSYVEDGSTVYIDSSSTCMYLIPLLAEKKDIKIVTNSIQSVILSSRYHLPCIVIGGNLYDKDMCMVGNIAMETLKNINTDVAFFSSFAISEDGVISDNDENQTAVRRQVFQNTGKAIFIFTKDKQNKRALYTVCRSEDAYRVIFE